MMTNEERKYGGSTEKELYEWCLDQTEAIVRGTLSQEKQKKLFDIGFKMQMSNYIDELVTNERITVKDIAKYLG